MEKTDRAELKKQFESIPPTVDGRQEEVFRKRFLDTIANIALAENDNDPAHNFLIGLAYLEGIDVEVNRQRALELITSAAEADLPEAMQKLADMYGDGSGAEFNIKEEFKWRQRIADYMVKTFGEKHPETLISLSNLANTYSNLGDYAKALELQEKLYNLQCEVLGKDDPQTVKSLERLSLYKAQTDS